jgi:hypothetical protein
LLIKISPNTGKKITRAVTEMTLLDLLDKGVYLGLYSTRGVGIKKSGHRGDNWTN